MVSKGKKSKTGASSFNKVKSSVSSTASTITDEIDKAREVVLREMQESFDVMSKRAIVASKKAVEATSIATKDITGTASDASESIMESIAETHLAKTFHKLIGDVEDVAEEMMQGITARFNQLQESAMTMTTTGTSATKKKSGIKKKVPATKKVAVK